MSISTALRLSLADYNRMVADGAFDSLGKRRIELIYGELREVTPPGPTHASCVDRLSRWSIENTDGRQITIRIQNPIEIPAYDSAREPDIVWAKAKDYSKQHPQPRDLLLVIEVADSSLNDDVGEMATLYAQAGVKDYWVVNIPNKCIEVFRKPKRGCYAEVNTHHVGETISPLVLPRIKLSVSGLFSGTL